MIRLDRVIALNIALMPMARSNRTMTNLSPAPQSFGPLESKLTSGGRQPQRMIGLFMTLVKRPRLRGRHRTAEEKTLHFRAALFQ
jgi:hypothetical protein